MSGRRLALLALAASACCRTPDRAPGAPDPVQLEPVAKALALTCQTVDREMNSGMPFGNAWLPPEVRNLGGHVNLSPDGARVEMGSRDHPSGYVLDREASASDAALSAWRLTHYGERGTRAVVTVRLARAVRLAPSEFVRRARVEYDRRVAAAPRTLAVHRERALFLLVFARADARAAFVEAAARLPDHFWPQVVLALVEHAAGEREAAARRVGSFAAAHQSYSTYSYLAQFHRLVGDIGEACAAMSRALELEVREQEGDLLNSSARAYEVAAAAYVAGRLDCASVIAAALEAREPDRYTRERFALPFRGLRAAVAFRQGNRGEALALVKGGLEERDPFYRDPESTLPALGRAVAAGDAAFVAKWRPAQRGQFDRELGAGLDLAEVLKLGAP